MNKKQAKIKNSLVQILIALSLSLGFPANGQIAISNISEIPKIKSSITYIAMKDPDSEKVKEYINVFKNNWTISKIEFIKYSEIENYLSPANSFFTISGFETHTSFGGQNQNGLQTEGASYTTIHVYLELWTCDENYFKRKKKKKFESTDKIQVGRIELFPDFKALYNPRILYETDYDADGHIRNWGPGILKNYLQCLMRYLDKGTERGLYSKILNSQEIKNLRKETLYVPDYVMIRFNGFTSEEGARHDEKNIFADYSLNYKIVSLEEVNQKITTDKNDFYYLIYIKSSTDKYISVINSLSGEIIYSKYSPLSYNISSGDLKQIQKKAEAD